jgi:transcriptional regulator with XRE-family HTH domain
MRRAQDLKFDKLDRTIVRVLKASREDQDISRGDLAKEIGWTATQVADMENLRKIVRASDLFRIARALKMEPDELVRRIQRW